MNDLEIVVMKYLNEITFFMLALCLSLIAMRQCSSTGQEDLKPRILISSDIGGTDPDDFQSMIHLLDVC